MAEVSALEPGEIFAEFEAQPPLRRPELIKQYLGMSVDWPVTFASAWESNSGMARVIFRFGRANVRMIAGDVSLSNYPQLKRLRAGEALRVRGRIRGVSILSIELDITELLFCLEAEPVAA